MKADLAVLLIYGASASPSDLFVNVIHLFNQSRGSFGAAETGGRQWRCLPLFWRRDEKMIIPKTIA